MTIHRLIRISLASLLLWASTARADLTQDWGTVATPLTSEVTFSFAQYNISNNFTDAYNFSLEGGADATYTVTFAFDPCRNGCGSPELSYGIYDQNGGLVTSTGGTVTLSAGNYSFQVKGTGMGSGNSVDYWGSVTFAAAPLASNSVAMVSPAPEPETWLLMLIGLAGLAGWTRRQQGESTWGAAT